MTLQPTVEQVAGLFVRRQPVSPLAVVGDRVVPVIDRSMGAGAFEVFDVLGPEGSGPPPHSHRWDESYFVLEGGLAVVDWAGGLENPVETVLEPGGSAFVPGGACHSFAVRSERCRFVIVATPGAHAFFADADATLGGRTDDIATLVAVAQRNGLQSPLFPPA